MFLEPAEDIIDTFADKLHSELNKWIDQILLHANSLVLSCEAVQGTRNTRFNQLVNLARNSYPASKIEKLQWVQVIKNLQ